MGLGLCAFKAFIWAYGVWSAQAIGYAAGAVFFPLVIAYLVAGRKKVYNPVRLGLWFFGCSLFFLFLEFARPHPSPEQVAIEIVREEMTGQPNPKSHYGQPPQDDLLREVLHDYIAASKVNQAKVAAITPDLKPLFSVESFSSPAAMQRCLDAVNRIYELDHEMLVTTEKWPQHVQEELAKSTLPVWYQQEFLKGITDSLTGADTLVLRRQIDPLELRWRDASVALYQFTLASAAHIRIKDQRILWDNQGQLNEFKDRMKKAMAAQTDLNQTNEQMTKARDRMLSKYGSSMEDLTQSSPAHSRQP